MATRILAALLAIVGIAHCESAPIVQLKGGRIDSLEPPLPPGAIARFGSLRYRHPGAAHDTIVTPDGKLAASAWSELLVVWNLEDGGRKYTVRDYDPPNKNLPTKGITFSADGRWLAEAATFDCSVRLRDANTGRIVRALGEGPARGSTNVGKPADSLCAIQYTPNNELLLRYGRNLAVYDPATGKEKRRVTAPAGQYFHFVSADGKSFLTRDAEPGTHNDRKSQVLTIGNVATGKERSRFAVSLQDGELLWYAQLSPDGKLVVGTPGPRAIAIWDAATGEERKRIAIAKPDTDTSSAAGVFAFGPENRELFAGRMDGRILRLDLTTGKVVAEFDYHAWVTSLTVSADGKTLIASGQSGVIRRWDLATNRQSEIPPGYGWGRLAVAPSGSNFAIADAEGRFDIWGANGRFIANLQTEGTGWLSAEFSRDGRRLRAINTAGVVHAWSTETWRPEPTIRLGGKHAPKSLMLARIDPEGRWLLTNVESQGAQYRAWDLRTGLDLWTGYGWPSDTCVFTPDGRTVIECDEKNGLNWRELSSGKTIRVHSKSAFLDADGKESSINGVSISGDGRQLATVHRNGAIAIRDGSTGELLRTIETRPECWSVRFSHTGDWLACSTGWGVAIIEVATGVELLRLSDNEAWVHDLQFGPDGKSLLTSAGPEVLLWSLRPTELKKSADPWAELRGDAVSAYRAQWQLLDDPVMAVTLLRDRLPPAVKSSDLEQLRTAVVELDANEFRKRVAAVKSLREAGWRAISLLRDGTSTSDEGRKARQELLANYIRQVPPNELRERRAVQVLELIATKPAREVLSGLAGGLADAPVTKSAKVALDRMAR